MKYDDIRIDYRIILDVIPTGAKALDLGCGNGDLCCLLAKEKGVKVQGIELNEQSIYSCVAKGVSVFHSDIDSGLPEYPNQSFDYVILNESLQEAKKVEYVLQEAMRVGKNVIIGFPNFAYITARAQLFFKGRSPVTPSLPYRWYNSPNLHFLSIKDFEDFCRKKSLAITGKYFLGRNRRIRVLPNLFAESAIFVVTK